MQCLFAGIETIHVCSARRIFAFLSCEGQREHWIAEESVCPCASNKYSPYTSAFRQFIGLVEQLEFYESSVLNRDQQLIYALTRDVYDQQLIRTTHTVCCFDCHDQVEKNAN